MLTSWYVPLLHSLIRRDCRPFPLALSSCCRDKALSLVPASAFTHPALWQVEIMRIKGTPTKDEMLSMNHNLADFNFPKIPDHTWPKVFRNRWRLHCKKYNRLFQNKT